MALTTAEITWITYILRNIGVSLSTAPILFCDNLSALYMTVNPVLHARTKHVEWIIILSEKRWLEGRLLLILFDLRFS